MPVRRFYGVSRLARELGIDPGTVSRKLAAGKTEEQIRAEAKQRSGLIQHGVTVRGRLAGETRKNGEATRESEKAKLIRGVGRLGDQPVAYTPSRKLAAASAANSPAGPKFPPTVPSPVPKPPPSHGHTNGCSNNSRTVQQGIEDLAAAQLRKESALASLREEELKQKRGELAPIVMVNAYICGMVIRAREILTRIGPELRDKLAVETDPVSIERMIDGEIRRALAELKEYRYLEPAGDAG